MQEWWILQFVAVQSLFSNKPMHLGKMEGDWLDKNQRGWWPKSSFLAHNTTPKLTQDTISAQKKVHTNMIFEVLYPSSPSSFAHGTPHSCRLFFFVCQSFWHYCQFEQIAQFLATDMLILLVINLIISHHITPWYPHEMIGFILPNIQLKVQVFIVKSAWFTVFHHVESTFF